MFRIALIAALGILFSGQAFATTAAPPHYPSPLTCTRNFYVSPSGTDNSTCGAGPMSNAANCRTPWGADAATSIGATGTTLTGGDCVNVLGTTPTQSTLGSSGWTNYDMGNGKTWNRSGTANSPSGYINYVCSINHGCKMTASAAAANTFSIPCIQGNYVAFDGFEIDGGNIQGYNGYANTNTNTYYAALQLFCIPSGTVHHHIHINGIYHGSGGGVGGSINGDYEYLIANEFYDFSGVNQCHTSGVNYYEPTKFTVGSPTTWDNLPAHIQILMNVVHDGGETSAESGSCSPQSTSHTDGNCITLDDWPHAQSDNIAYTPRGLVAYNLVYNCGGRGILQQGATNATFINNTIWAACLDQVFSSAPPTIGGCPELGALAVNLSSTTSTIQNNIIVRTTGAVGDSSGTYNTGGFAFRMDGGTATGITNNFDYDFKIGGNSLGVFSTGSDATQTATLVANNTLNTNPLLNSPITDFHPIATSPVLGKGASNSTAQPVVALTTADGIIPNSPPDVGALSSASAPSFAGPASINAGGPAVGIWLADIGASGGATVANNPTGAVDTSLVANPAPTLVYRSERYGNFSYAIPQLKVGNAYIVNLHFTEDFETASAQRLMDVSINGTNVLSSFDIFAATGAQHKAIVKTFTATADTNGLVTIAFSPHTGSPDGNAKVDGVEVLTPVPVPPIPGTFSYVAGRWYVLNIPTPAATAPVAHLANVIRCTPVSMRNTATINNVSARIYTADASGHLKFGIYANGSDNRPAALVASSAAISTATAGSAPTVALSVNVQGGPAGTNISDKIWVCSNTDSATASFASVSSNEGDPATSIGTATSANILQSVGSGAVINHISCSGANCNGGSSTYGTFPASLAASTWTEQTSVNMPMIAVQFVSVP